VVYLIHELGPIYLFFLLYDYLRHRHWCCSFDAERLDFLVERPAALARTAVLLSSDKIAGQFFSFLLGFPYEGNRGGGVEHHRAKPYVGSPYSLSYEL